MALSYEDLHDGESPKWHQRMTVAYGKGCAIGPIKELSYSKKAGGKTRIYEHDLQIHKGRRPYLVTDDGEGSPVTIEKPSKDLQALGRAVDCVLSSGERILLGGLYVVTDNRGDIVMLASPYDLDIQIEQRGAHVTKRGIEA